MSEMANGKIPCKTCGFEINCMFTYCPWCSTAQHVAINFNKCDTQTKILQWLATGEKGISSEAIAFKMAGVVPGNKRSWPTHPYDPSDFKRCLKLVNFIPEIRSRLDEMRSISREWNAIIEHWKEVEECFMGEVAEWLTDEHSNKRAHKTYILMRKVYADAVTQNLSAP